MFRSITWCYRHYLYVLKNPFQNALFMYLESNFSVSKSVLDIHVEEWRKLFKKLLESAGFCISTALRRDLHIEKLLWLCVPKVLYWATTICIGACCREFNQNSNLWETKQIEKTHVKENNYTYKTIFTWFGNLPTFTELQGFHYKIKRYNSAQEHS